MHDLLHDPLISIRTTLGAQRVSLPELLASLCEGTVDAYMGVRPHQSDPFHVLLVQLAASVVARRGNVTVSTADEWRDGLLELAGGQASAWHLIEADASKPAFLQHPLRSADELGLFKEKARTPDELDVLVTAKDHDVKMARAPADSLESWLYALIAYQTSSGFLGAGNYGIVRMNGGFGSRAVVSTVASLQPARRFREELELVCAMRAATVARHKLRESGTVLTWLSPWEREGHQHMLADLEPWFIEAARPIRLALRLGRACALGATSKARQLGPKVVENGDVGDPWTAINVAGAKKGRSALTLSASGWTPERIAKLLFQQDYELTALQAARPGHGDMWMTGAVVVRGQGTTDGFHAFRLRIPAPVRRSLLSRSSAQSLGEFSNELLKDARDCEKALGLALLVLGEGGREDVNLKNETVNRWARQVREDWGRAWAERFFPTLWAAADESEREEVRQTWRRSLVAAAEELLRQADRSLPLPSARHYRAVTRAEGTLRASLRKAGLLSEFTPVHEEQAVHD